VERRHHLQQHLLNLVERQLAEQRHIVGVMPAAVTDKTSLLHHLTADFSHSYPKLEAWSALYHRYFSAVALDVQELTTAVPGKPAASEKLLQRRLNAGLKLLVGRLQQEEIAAHSRYQRQPHHLRRHLPLPDYAQLFGIDPLLDRLTGWLSDNQAPPFISIEGIGGIGKTAVARAAAHQLATQPQWQDILWISARQHRLDIESGQMRDEKNAAQTFADIVRHLTEQLGQTHLAGLDTAVKVQRLQPLLRGASHLIIIDNLETLADLEALVPHLHPLASPTRFLLTSRHSLSQYPFVACLPVPDLSLDNCRLLIESELARRGQAITLAASDMQAIYNVVGGLPLALKLVAAQMARLNLNKVLAWLQQANWPDPYRYIYQHSWQMLSIEARAFLLEIVDIAAVPAKWELLACIGWPEQEMKAAVDELIDACLLETDHTTDGLRYYLHRLTVTFLQTDILGWGEGLIQP
jgi:hypothetical protein